MSQIHFYNTRLILRIFSIILKCLKVQTCLIILTLKVLNVVVHDSLGRSVVQTSLHSTHEKAVCRTFLSRQHNDLKSYSLYQLIQQTLAHISVVIVQSLASGYVFLLAKTENKPDPLRYPSGLIAGLMPCISRYRFVMFLFCLL